MIAALGALAAASSVGMMGILIALCDDFWGKSDA